MEPWSMEMRAMQAWPMHSGQMSRGQTDAWAVEPGELDSIPRQTGKVRAPESRPAGSHQGYPGKSGWAGEPDGAEWKPRPHPPGEARSMKTGTPHMPERMPRVHHWVERASHWIVRILITMIVVWIMVVVVMILREPTKHEWEEGSAASLRHKH